MPTLTHVHVLPDSHWLSYLQLKMRDRSADLATFTHHANQVIRLLLQNAAQLLPCTNDAVTTPISDRFSGNVLTRKICGVSVISAGESMEAEFRSMFPDHPISKILIQRDKESKLPHYFYSHLPQGIAGMSVMLFEPMLATGGSLLKAIDVLKESGVAVENIIVVNVLASPYGLQRLTETWPELKIVTSSVEKGMTESAFMRPGIGDFGDRYFGTYPGASHE
ncbi:uracil phosphoribosyltransferase [Pantoea sp. GD03673]|uniref:uracil phosphoribosyltransferase n=1 Tax=Pantoea sp. GD03673 TaxID=2975364 RepID=UPI00244D1A5F|nr:uracil phosphoribosyltransferase [Pantoea sp. GD03673]MDH2067096.1 uracil phosphoribosyltransferase [Pantoea sp. GD03673]